MSREPLDREIIIIAALKILDRSGLQKLSMRRLGEELGVQAMSLYNHVANKGDLLNGIHEHLMAQVAPPQSGEDWRVNVRQTSLSFRELLKNHPAAIPLFASRSAKAPGSLKFLDQCIGILLEAGFSPERSLRAFQTIFAYTLGHAQFYFGLRDADSYVETGMYVTYPHLAALPPMSDYDPDLEFSEMMEMLLENLVQ